MLSNTADGEESVGADTASSDKVFRRKAKKLRKRARNGEILTLEQTLECAKYGVMVKAEVEWSASLLEGKRGQLHVSEVRDLLLHILSGKESHKPGWLTLTNAGLVSKVVIVGLSGVDSQYLVDNMSQLPFMQACSKALPITYFKGQGVRKAIYPLLFYKPEKGAKARKEEEEDADSDDEEQDAEGGEEGEEEEEEEDALGDDESGSDVTVSVDPVERYVMGPSQLRMHGYPVPPKALAEQEAQVLAAAAKEAGGVEVAAVEEEDLGEPLEGPAGEGEGAATSTEGQSTPAWLACDTDGVWGETGSLVPSLEQAKAILARLPAHKLTEAAPTFYETLGGRDPEEVPPYKMVALDCEMCQTCEGNEVTRLTLVDERRAVLLDAFIKPYNPITDYHTRYSGITPEIMATCDTRLEQVQVALLRLIRADTILVGHSLEQDLMVVRLMHLRCIDTAILYPHPRGGQCRFALRVLSKKYLRRVIQNSKAGHCSEEDAVAALDLVHLKVSRGPEFGLENLVSSEDTRGRLSLLDLLHENGKRSVLVDVQDTLVKCVRGRTAALVAHSNDEVLNKVKAQANAESPPHFIWAALSGARPPTLDSLAIRKQRAMESQSKRIKLERTENITAGNMHMNRHIKFTYEEAIMEMVDRELLKADQALAEIFDSLSPSTLLIVLTQPDVSLPSQLTMQKQAALDVRATLPWGDDNEAQRQELSRLAQEGLIMMRVR